MPALPSLSRPRELARARGLRRLRILASVQAGLSYAAIGRDESVSRERVRQIVAQALDDDGAETKLDHARVQMARLEPALRLAARAVGDGELGAIDRLIKVLDRLDKYGAVEGSGSDYYQGGRERLLTKLNTMAERMLRAREAAASADESPAPPSDDDGLDEAEGLDPAQKTSAASSGWLDLA